MDSGKVDRGFSRILLILPKVVSRDAKDASCRPPDYRFSFFVTRTSEDHCIHCLVSEISKGTLNVFKILSIIILCWHFLRNYVADSLFYSMFNVKV